MKERHGTHWRFVDGQVIEFGEPIDDILRKIKNSSAEKKANVSGTKRRWITLTVHPRDEKFLQEIESVCGLADAELTRSTATVIVPVKVRLLELSINVPEPHQRENLVEWLRSKGYVVLGNGDGDGGW